MLGRRYKFDPADETEFGTDAIDASVLRPEIAPAKVVKVDTSKPLKRQNFMSSQVVRS